MHHSARSLFILVQIFMCLVSSRLFSFPVRDNCYVSVNQDEMNFHINEEIREATAHAGTMIQLLLAISIPPPDGENPNEEIFLEIAVFAEGKLEA